MKKALLLFILVYIYHLSSAQQDKQLTHYRFDRMSFNPAATGFKGYCGTFIYRNQWDRVMDAPNTSLLNLQANFPRQNMGVGISLMNDAIGFQRNNNVTFNAAYHLRTKAGILSGGLGVGLINVSFKPNWVPPQTDDDPALPDAVAGTDFDINAGLFWHGTTAPYYVGISTTHIAPATLENIYYSVARHYYILAGYDLQFSLQRRVDIKPSVLIKADGATAIFDLNVMADVWLNNFSYLWGGLSYRLEDAIALSAGYAFSPSRITSQNMLKIGYSFDVMTNPLNTYGRGTHELMLNFCLFPPPPATQRHGNPFFLE